ncbi:hypothetical protein D7V95_03775 [bacterium J10(2018)]|nr:hypothetical protein D7V95_03775 [bacterium J10(2018)]
MELFGTEADVHSVKFSMAYRRIMHIPLQPRIFIKHYRVSAAVLCEGRAEGKKRKRSFALPFYYG